MYSVCIVCIVYNVCIVCVYFVDSVCIMCIVSIVYDEKEEGRGKREEGKRREGI